MPTRTNPQASRVGPATRLHATEGGNPPRSELGTGIAFAPTSLGAELAPTEGGDRGAADRGVGANVTQLGFAWQAQ